MIKTVFIDLDGVIVHIARTLAELDGFTCVLAWSENLRDKTDDFFKESMTRHTVSSKAFENAYPMSDFLEFVLGLRHIKNMYPEIQFKILSSTSSLPIADEVGRQKRIWLKKNINDIIDIEEVILTKGAKQKVKHGSHDSVLIDDHPSTKKMFEEAGFPFIYHTSANKSLNALTELLETRNTDSSL